MPTFPTVHAAPYRYAPTNTSSRDQRNKMIKQNKSRAAPAPRPYNKTMSRGNTISVITPISRSCTIRKNKIKSEPKKVDAQRERYRRTARKEEKRKEEKRKEEKSKRAQKQNLEEERGASRCKKNKCERNWTGMQNVQLLSHENASCHSRGQTTRAIQNSTLALTNSCAWVPSRASRTVRKRLDRRLKNKAFGRLWQPFQKPTTREQSRPISHLKPCTAYAPATARIA